MKERRTNGVDYLVQRTPDMCRPDLVGAFTGEEFRACWDVIAAATGLRSTRERPTGGRWRLGRQNGAEHKENDHG